MNSSRCRAIRLTVAAIAASLFLSALCFAMFALSLMGAFDRGREPAAAEPAAAEPAVGLVICAEDGEALISVCDF